MCINHSTITRIRLIWSTTTVKLFLNFRRRNEKSILNSENSIKGTGTIFYRWTKLRERERERERESLLVALGFHIHLQHQNSQKFELRVTSPTLDQHQLSTAIIQVAHKFPFSVSGMQESRFVWQYWHWTLTHWGRGHLNCLNARYRGF